MKATPSQQSKQRNTQYCIYYEEIPACMHEHIKTYGLDQLKDDILNDKWFGFIHVDIETPVFKNAQIKFEDMGEYMQDYRITNNIKFNKGKTLIGWYFGKEIVLYSPLSKW